MIIDATNLIIGRVASIAAKKALLGETVSIVNCEKAMMTGRRQEILLRYREIKARKAPTKGPYIYRMPDRFVRRIIRGMLPYKYERGRKAFEKVKCYIGVPSEFNNQKLETIAEINIAKVPNLRYITVGEICKSMGAKI
jgi:large subunit ribosomal protein L13